MITVVIPVYNVEKYIKECLDSVLNQTFSDFEVICVNDGSTDKSLSILEEYTKKDTRIKVISQQNQGLSDARNTGIDTAQGKYIYFLDSDDWIEPDTLEVCYNTAEENQLDELVFNRINVYENDEIKKTIPPDNNNIFPTTTVMTGKELFTLMMHENFFRSPVQYRFFLRAFLLENKLHFYSKLIHEDDLFSTQCAFFSKRSMFLDRKLYHHRRRENSIMTKQVSFQRFISCAIIHRELSALLLKCTETSTKEALMAYMEQNLFRATHLYEHMDHKIFPERYAEQPDLIYFYGMLQLSLVQHKKFYREGARDKTAEITSGLTWRLGHILLWLPLKIMQLLKGRENG